MAPTVRVVVVVAASAVVACFDGLPPTPSRSFVLDSAGVTIVQHGSGAAPVVTIRATSPSYRVGWDPAGPTFEHVVSGALLSDGRAAIGDRGNQTVTVLSSSGGVERVLGGFGSGPEEIGFLITISRLGPDTIVVEDDGNGRITLFHGDSLVRIVQTKQGASPWPLMALGVSGGALMMQRASSPPEFPEPWLPGFIARLDLASGQVDTLKHFDWIPSPIGRTRFHPMGVAGVTEGALLVGRSDRAEIERSGLDGQVIQVLRFPREQPVITDDVWASYREWFMSDPVVTVDAETRATLFRRMRPRLGQPLPFFGRLDGDDLGNVWVGDYSVNTRTTTHYDVFSPDGSWLASVSLPAHFQVLDIYDGRMLGVEYNEFGEAAIVLLPLDPRSWGSHP